MDFARKQMEKYGWKDGIGLGKESQGITVAIKPQLKTGKEGMGYDLGHELTDTWWTKAYSDSLSRVNVNVNNVTNKVDVTIQDDDNNEVKEKKKKSKKSKKEKIEDRPMEKMRKKMLKANFTSFSKGGTLNNGEMLVNETSSPDADSDQPKVPSIKILSDEELLKACGGRTAHKAARFGLKLNGKLARIAAQEQFNLPSDINVVSVSINSNSNEPDSNENDDEVTIPKKSKKSKKRKISES